jgi:predicted SnoaL-like aldol condensation-catalyzing enzyme
VLVGVLIIACDPENTADSRQSEANAAVVQRLLDEVWVRQNVSAMNELLAPEYRYHANSFDTSGETLQEARSGIERDFREYSDISIRVVDLFTTADRGALQWVWRAVHNASGRPVEIHINTVYRFEGGRIVEAWDGYDYTGVALQLGYRIAPADTAR